MSSSVVNPILVSIEGNIGSGKSTLLKRLRELEPGWMFVDEPVDSWLKIKNDDGKSLLEVFYNDIQRWAYTFQNAAVLSRGQMVQEAVMNWHKGFKSSRVILMERCVETDRNVFAKMLRQDGKLNGIEWTLYEKWYDFITGMIPKIDAFIWVDTEAEVCSQRIKIRAREGEDDIPLEYLKNLEKVHKEWLVRDKLGSEKVSNVYVSQNIEDIRAYINLLDTTPSDSAE